MGVDTWNHPHTPTHTHNGAYDNGAFIHCNESHSLCCKNETETVTNHRKTKSGLSSAPRLQVRWRCSEISSVGGAKLPSSQRMEDGCDSGTKRCCQHQHHLRFIRAHKPSYVTKGQFCSITSVFYYIIYKVLWLYLLLLRRGPFGLFVRNTIGFAKCLCH